MSITYIAVDITVRRVSGKEESLTLSVNNCSNDYTLKIHELLVKYIAYEIFLIEDIKEVQSFLLNSGYGLYNCTILTASNLYEATL